NLPQQKTQFSPGGWALGRILSIVGVGQPAAGLWATDTLPGSASSRTGPFVVARCLGPELTGARLPVVAAPHVTAGAGHGLLGRGVGVVQPCLCGKGPQLGRLLGHVVCGTPGVRGEIVQVL